ncbi:hypothetical protein JCM9803A_12670 [Rhodococcus erythropolis]
MKGEPTDGVGKLGWFDDDHWGGERNARNRHGEPAEIFAADLDKAAVRCHLDRCVVNPSEYALEVGERSFDGEFCIVVTGWRAD